MSSGPPKPELPRTSSAWSVRVAEWLRAAETALSQPLPQRVLLGVLFAVGFAVRAFFSLHVHPPARFVSSDMFIYQERARHLLSGTLTHWDSFTPVGFPALLALVQRAGGSYRALAVIQSVLGAAAILPTVAIARRVTGSALIAALSGLILAFYAPLILYTGLLLSETLCSFLLLHALDRSMLAAERRVLGDVALAALLWGLAIVTRPNVSLALPALLFAAVRLRWPWRDATRAALLFGCVLALPIGASAAYYSKAVGSPTLTATNGGLNFYLNFSELRGIEYRTRGEGYDIYPVPNLLRYERVEHTRVPFYDQAEYYRLGLQELAHHPRRALYALDNLRLGSGMGPITFWPGFAGHEAALRDWSRGFFFWCALPSLIYAAFLVFRARRSPPSEVWRQMLLLVLASCAFGLYAFLGDPRLRVPFDPLFIVFALDGAARLLAWSKSAETEAVPHSA